MVKKDKKSKAAEKKVRVAEKKGKKSAKSEKKSRTKGNDDDSGDSDVDLDAVLAEFANQQAQFLKVTEIVCDPPSPRASSILIGSPSNEKELFLFGGEYYNGAIANFYNDLFIYHLDRDEWRRVTSPNSPLPRSGHAWCRGGNAGGIYLFGGEFSSPKQGTFYHYNDFWRLDPANREWTRIEHKGRSPPARSGHRMTYFKNYVILYGGFQDTSQQTKYLSDLWIYDCQNFVWHNPVLPAVSQKPDARSSFSFLPHDGGAVIYGGYSRVKATATTGRQAKGSDRSTRAALKPMIHQDTWLLRITQPSAEQPSTTAPIVRWERRKKPANLLNPSRAGATMVHHKGRGILFGGVHDVEESEEGIDSEFFGGLFAWNIDRNRFFQLTLRKPRGPQKARQLPNQGGGGRRGREKADGAELLRNLAALEKGESIADSEMMDIHDQAVDEVADGPARPPKPTTMELPHRRFNAQLAVQGDVLFMYGGTFEQGDREFTFDDMSAIDLSKLDGVKQIFQREPENWLGSEDEDSGDEDDEEGSSDEEGETDRPPEGMDLDVATPTEPAMRVNAEEVKPDPASDSLGPDLEEEPAVIDNLPHPRPFETLRDFYYRTSVQWQEVLIEDYQLRGAAPESTSIKELKKDAFTRAEAKWWDSREEITVLEDAQEEAGIGEVVSIVDRGEKAAGAPAARRR